MSDHERASSITKMLKQAEDVVALQERELLKEEMGLTEDKNKVLDVARTQDLQRALKDPVVRRVFRRLFEMSGILKPYGDPNPIVMAHHAGRVSIGLELYEACEAVAPGVYLQMCQEAKSNEKSQEDKDA